MRINAVFSLLATCAFLTATPIFAMDSEEASQRNAINAQPVVSLETQLEKVSAFITQRKSALLPVKMVLGATNLEYDRISDESYIFFDVAAHNPQGKPYIQELS